MNDAGKIARLLRQRQATVTGLMRQYRCAYATMMRAVLSHISKAEYNQLKRDRMLAANCATRWQRGHKPWNKDLKGIHLSPASEFKKGCLRGRAARRWRPIGTITIRYDKLFPWQHSRRHNTGKHRKGEPRRWIKIRDDGLPQNRWVPYARFLWEKRHGLVPAGYLIVHRDGNQMNDIIDNLIIVDRRLHLHRTSHSNPEVVDRRTRRAVKTRKRNTVARRILRRQIADASSAWYCPTCGATYETDTPPQRCSKCSSYSFERISLPRTHAARYG